MQHRSSFDGRRHSQEYGDWLDAFCEFDVIEERLERLEEPVSALVSEVDEFISSDIDRLGGK